MSRALSLALHLVVTGAAIGVLTPRPVHAEESKAEEAIKKGREGVTLYERGQWAEALAAFREADALFHSPVLTLYTARSLRNLGRLVESARVYETLAREVLAADAPRTWAQAQLDGKAELKALEAETPRLVVDVGAARDVSASVDGTAVVAGSPVPLDPGEHLIEVRGTGGLRSRKVTLRRGEGTIRIGMGLPSETRAPSTSTADGGTDGFAVLGLVLTGVGGATLAAAGVVGIVALNEASSADEALPGSCTAERECLPKERAAIEAEYDAAYTTASIADGLFIGGGIVAAAGIALLIIDPGASSQVRPTATRGGGGLKLSF